jgi:hypothetical protein
MAWPTVEAHPTPDIRELLVNSSTIDPPTTASGIKRPSTKSTLCRGSRLLLALRASALFGIVVWPLYLQQRTVGVLRPWAKERTRFRGRASATRSVACGQGGANHLPHLG